VSDPEGLVEVYTSSGPNPYSDSSYPDYFDLRDSGTFSSLAAYTPVSITMDANGQPEPLAGQLVSGNYFEVLGVKPRFGRGRLQTTIDSGRPFAWRSFRMRCGSARSMPTSR
jgi:putative ABC transport system permease protein